MNAPIVQVHRLTKTFGAARINGRPGCVCTALRDVSFQVGQGEKVALLGASGSGKSTLIRLLCGLEHPDPTSGEIRVNGVALFTPGHASFRSDIQRARSSIGVVFQQFNLIGQLSVLENVLVGLCSELSVWRILSRTFPREFRAIALDCLDKVGLAEKADQRASTLSGGQQQRVAVARALAKGARIILADEPVASLDPESSRRVMEILTDLTTQFGMTLIVSLHQTDIAKRFCTRAIALRHGELVFDGPTDALSEERLRQLYGMQVSGLIDTRDVAANALLSSTEVAA